MNRFLPLLAGAALTLSCQGLPAAEYYLATTGDDAHAATADVLVDAVAATQDTSFQTWHRYVPPRTSG